MVEVVFEPDEGSHVFGTRDSQRRVFGRYNLTVVSVN
jgi:hypothetical protein